MSSCSSQLWSRLQDYNWLWASRGLSAMTELLVSHIAGQNNLAWLSLRFSARVKRCAVVSFKFDRIKPATHWPSLTTSTTAVNVRRCVAGLTVRRAWRRLRSPTFSGRCETKLHAIYRLMLTSANKVICCSRAANADRFCAPVCADATGNPVDCHLQEFACGGRCIPRSRLCDHELDCTTDGADESPQLCSQSARCVVDGLS